MLSHPKAQCKQKEKLPQTIENSNFLESLKEKYCFALRRTAYRGTSLGAKLALKMKHA